MRAMSLTSSKTTATSGRINRHRLKGKQAITGEISRLTVTPVAVRWPEDFTVELLESLLAYGQILAVRVFYLI